MLDTGGTYRLRFMAVRSVVVHSITASLFAASHAACVDFEPAEELAGEPTTANHSGVTHSGTPSAGDTNSEAHSDSGADAGSGDSGDADADNEEDSDTSAPDMMASGCLMDQPEAGLYCVGARPFHVAVVNLDGTGGPEIVVSNVGTGDISVFHAGKERLELAHYSPLRASVKYSDLHHVVVLPTNDPSKLRMAVFLFKQVPERDVASGRVLNYSRYEMLDSFNDFGVPRLLQDWTLDGLWYLGAAPWSSDESSFVSISAHGEMALWRDVGAEGFVRGVTLDSPMLSASAVHSSDVTGDGIDDLVVFTHALLDEEPGQSGLVVFPGTVLDTPGAAIVSAWPMGTTGRGELADVTGDGYLDAVALDLEALVVVPGLGDGYFDVNARHEIEFDGSEQGFRGPELTTADFNHDGRSDVALTRCGDGIVQIYLADLSGVPVLTQSLDVGPCTHIANGDLLGGGEVDLVVTLADRDQIQIIRGEGDGSFSVL